MAIEFRCTQCNKLLRTGDDTAGKHAKCPECGAVMTIPEATVNGGGSAPPPPPPLGGNPFGPAGPQPSFPADTGNPYQSPREIAPTARGAISPGTLDLGDILSRTWTLFKADWGICVGVALIVMALNYGVSMVSQFIPIVGLIVAILFQIWIQIGQALFFLKKARGREVAIGEIFNGGPFFGNILLASLLVGLMVFGIALVLVAPLALVGMAISKDAAVILAVVGAVAAVGAIWYVSLMLSQFYYLILDRNVGVIDSLKMSNDLMEGNKLTLFLINLVVGALGVLAVILTCGLGLLIVTPYVAMMQAVIYLTIIGQPTAEQRQRGLAE